MTRERGEGPVARFVPCPKGEPVLLEPHRPTNPWNRDILLGRGKLSSDRAHTWAWAVADAAVGQFHGREGLKLLVIHVGDVVLGLNKKRWPVYAPAAASAAEWISASAEAQTAEQAREAERARDSLSLDRQRLIAEFEAAGWVFVGDDALHEDGREGRLNLHPQFGWKFAG